MSSPAIQTKPLENLPERVKIETLEIIGFRGIKHAKINLHDINILIGANGAGKSNILSALFLFSEQNYPTFTQFFNDLGGNSTLFYGGVKSNPIIKIKVEMYGQKNYSKTVKLEYVSGGRIQISYFSSLEVDSKSFTKEKTYRFDDKIVEFSESLAEDDPISIFLKENDEKATQFFGTSEAYRFNDTSPRSPIRQPSYKYETFVLKNMGENLAAWVYLFSLKHPNQFNFFQSLVRRVIPHFDCFVLRPDPFNKNQIRLEYRNVGRDLLLSAAHLSDGSLRFIALAVLLLFNPPPLVIIDEPELGLHPTALQLIADLIRQASFESQIIVATQSADFLNQFEPHQILVVEREEDSEETLVKRLDATEIEGWLEDYSIGDLWLKNVLGGKP